MAAAMNRPGRTAPSSLGLRPRAARAALAVLALSLSACGFAGRAMSRNLAELTRPPAPAPLHVLEPHRADARLAVLWIGHATVLLQLDDLTFLTDPVFTRTVGALSPRLVAPGLSPGELPPIDAAVISHAHFDHLSFTSLGLIEDRTSQLLVPPGILEYLPRYRFDVHEVPTWSTVKVGEAAITAVPVHHVGGRYGLDEAWCDGCFTGYVFQLHGLTVYFGGDTAYAPDDFRAARARFPHIDLAILPIGPIAPRDFMRRTHMDPGEALQAFADLGADRMMPIHFDTFINSDDQPGDCLRELHRVMAARSIDPARVVELEIGEQRVVLPRERP